MRRLSIKSGFLAGVFALVLLGSSTAMAIGRPVQAEGGTTTTQATTSQQTAADHQAAAQTRLADAKLKACQNRETAINNILARIADRGQKQLNLFTGISTKVEAFYVTKGKTLSSYDQLVTDVNVKKVAAQTAVDTIKSTSVSFKCDGTDPKGAIQSFKADLTSEIHALQDYRTAVKNLIVGVKSVQGITSSSTNGATGGQ